jgi:hypothetical protein
MKQNKFKLYALALVATFTLTSCADNSRYISIDENYAKQHSKNERINYKPNVNIVNKDLRLKSIIEKSEDKLFNVTDSTFATLNLFAESSVIDDPLAKPQVKLVGILKQKENKYSYQVNYKLVDGIDNTISQGKVIGVNPTSTKSLTNAPAKASKSSLEDAAEQIIESINAELNNILIDFKIVSVSKQSVFIAINKGIRLSSEEVFLVNELPNTALSLKGIISAQGGYDLAELKVITGQFPKMGMTVNLQK